MAQSRAAEAPCPPRAHGDSCYGGKGREALGTAAPPNKAAWILNKTQTCPGTGTAVTSATIHTEGAGTLLPVTSLRPGARGGRWGPGTRSPAAAPGAGRARGLRGTGRAELWFHRGGPSVSPGGRGPVCAHPGWTAALPWPWPRAALTRPFPVTTEPESLAGLDVRVARHAGGVMLTRRGGRDVARPLDVPGTRVHGGGPGEPCPALWAPLAPRAPPRSPSPGGSAPAEDTRRAGVRGAVVSRGRPEEPPPHRRASGPHPCLSIAGLPAGNTAQAPTLPAVRCASVCPAGPGVRPSDARTGTTQPLANTRTETGAPKTHVPPGP